MLRLLVLIVGPVVAIWPCAALAEVFLLANGGRVEGELLNPDQTPRESYLVRTVTGGQLTLGKDQVKRVIALSEAERRYEELLPRMPQTAEGNWKMAEWCRKKGLAVQRTFHLQQVIRHDPDHQQARHGLRYSRVKGHWVLAEEWMKGRGFVRHRGGWRLPQELALENNRRQIELAEKDWRRKLKRWRGSIGKKRHEEALRQIHQIRDPLAAAALAEMLPDESNHEMKLLYVEVLGRLDNPRASDALIRCALQEKSAALRDSCLDQLQNRGTERAVAQFIKTLRSKSNRKVNRAAVGLARLKDAAAVLPLIDALVTKHKFLVFKGTPGNLSTSFGRTSNGKGGISGFGAGGGGPKIEIREIPNSSALNALVLLTEGVNYQYDEGRWKQWYASAHAPPRVNLRRDD